MRKLITESYINYNNRDELFESFSFEEWNILEDMDSAGGKHTEFEKGGKRVAKYVGAAFVPFGVIALYLFRKYTDTCNQKCGMFSKQGDPKGKYCYNMCYAAACDKAITNATNKVSAAIRQEKDEKKQKKLMDKFYKDLNKWKDRKAKYIAKAKEAKQLI